MEATDRVVRGRVQGATGAQLLSRMVDAMAPIEPQLIETDWDAIPALVRQVTTHRALVVLLTSIDARHARLEMPYPVQESTFDVIELKR